MIEYFILPYGVNLLLRSHGSALYKSCIPGLIAVGVFYLFLYLEEIAGESEKYTITDPTIVIDILITSITFLIVFRANFGYDRYWEACEAVHEMMGLFMDGTVCTAAFHMQCRLYDEIRPPSLFEHPDAVNPRACMDRTVLRDAIVPSDLSSSGNCTANTVLTSSRLDGGWGLLYKPSELPFSARDWPFGYTPSLFLQELAHLSSLTAATAFASLRNRIDTNTYYYTKHHYHDPWPQADPDKIPEEHIKHQILHKSRIVRNFQFFFDTRQTNAFKIMHNKARKLPVIYGVSPNELNAINNSARGPSAKLTLPWYWLSEFITREHLHNNTGDVGPPIISRIHQFLSDGMKSYNTARKIMYIPFPFPHAQLTTLFTIVLIIYIPIMYGEYTTHAWLGAILTFFTVTSLFSLLSSSRELENPYSNMPNDLPLNTLLGMYNESLVAMCSGFHPDHYSWEHGLSVGENGCDAQDPKGLETALEEQVLEIERLQRALNEFSSENTI